MNLRQNEQWEMLPKLTCLNVTVGTKNCGGHKGKLALKEKKRQEI